ncbi:MAG: endonuclease VII domain-containing protein [Ignavibacteriaceae bacterium]|jgi:hypothetical protein|nr:endonuclease VII domain-containing protein [Ignavibacteriaceae bacterium]
MKIYDCVFLLNKISDIEINSVGIVLNVLETNLANVFFIGKREEVLVNLNDVKYLDVSKTGKPYEYKICNVCHILKKDFEDFEINQTDAKGRKTTRPTCRTCRTVINGLNLTIKEKHRLNGIKPKNFFICPICGKGSIPGKTANIVKDHDHITGKGREWLCDSCNTGLGRFKDDIELLKKAITYLEKHKHKSEE